MFELSSRINEIKKACNLNNKQLEEKLGLANGYINDIERGKNKNPSKLITALFEILRISPNWIFSGKGTMYLDDDVPSAVETSIPLLRQTVSCGPGQEWGDSDNIECYIKPLELVPALKGKHIFAFRVRGTSMVGAGINDGDVLLFDGSQEQTFADDLYVFALDGSVFCKWIKFDSISRRIEIYSLHTSDISKAELIRTIDGNDDIGNKTFHVFGRVLAWIHENRLTYHP